MSCNTIVAVDIGGTNARFARAGLAPGEAPTLTGIRKYKVADYPSLTDAWRRFAEDEGGSLPDRAAIALAAPTAHTPIKLTNSHWIVDPDELADTLGLKRVMLVNDFEAIAHGATLLPSSHLHRVFGPEGGLPRKGVATVIGPGTGLGVAIVSMGADGAHILPTEGGHMDFAPVDEADDRMLDQLRQRFGRVSVERLVSGPGLNHIYQALAAMAGDEATPTDDATLWQAALSGGNPRAAEALDRLCMCYGAVAGDLALAHGAACVVLAGSLTQRMRQYSGFARFHERFLLKGRYRDHMAEILVLFADHPELGLFGAAVAGAALTGD